MLLRSPIAALALATALLAGTGAHADDLAKYPDLNGQWAGVGTAQDAPWDPGKPPGAAPC